MVVDNGGSSAAHHPNRSPLRTGQDRRRESPTPTPPPIELVSSAFDRESLATIRHQIEAAGSALGMPEADLYPFLVAVNEITTNAVRHGGGSGHLRLWYDHQSVYCDITDSGPGLPPTVRPPERRPPPHTIGGRGLWLARHGTDAITIHTGAGGNLVRLTRRLPPYDARGLPEDA